MRVDLIQTNFTSGEISPSMYGRSDTTRYANGAKRIRNFIVRPQGGLTRRSGTDFINETQTSSKKSIVRPFIFSETQAYILEIGHFYIRIYRDGGLLLNGIGMPLEITSPWTEDDLAQLHTSQSADVLYISHPGYQTRTLSRFSDLSWLLDLYQTTDGPYLSNQDATVTMTLSAVSDTATLTASTAIFTDTATDAGKYIEFREDNLWRLGKIVTVQSTTEATITYFENLILGIPSDVVTKAVTSNTVAGGATGRYAPTTVVLVTGTNLNSDHSGVFGSTDVGKYVRKTVTLLPGQEAWYLATALVDSSNLTVSAPLATRLTYTYPGTIVTVSNHVISATVTSSAPKFAITDVSDPGVHGRHMRFNFASAQTWGEITAVATSTSATIRIYHGVPPDQQDATRLSNEGATTDWKFGAWSGTSGWPSVSVFHEQRLSFGNTRTEPQTIWMSQTDDYGNFAPTELDSSVLDTNAITYTIASNQVNSICWMESGPTMLVGTIGAEWQVKSASNISAPLSPSNVSVLPQTSYGSERFIRSRKVGSSVLFVQKAGKKVRELVYNFQTDSYQASDITLIADHILEDGDSAIQTEYQQEPYSLIWALRSDGKLASLTYEKDQEVNAWHLHSLGGTDALVESIAVIPGGLVKQDILYMVVSRSIGGVRRRYIEKMTPYSACSNNFRKEDANFLDCSLRYVSAFHVTGVNQLLHLEGETVRIFGDGADLGTAIVTGGFVIVPTPSQNVLVGYTFESLMESLPPDGGNPIGTAQGKVKRPHKMVIRVVNSLGYKQGPDEDHLTEMSFRDSGDPMDSTPPLFTGDKTHHPENTYDLSGTYVIAQDNPYPFNLLAVYTSSKVTEVT